jgi:hypothetical protein
MISPDSKNKQKMWVNRLSVLFILITMLFSCKNSGSNKKLIPKDALVDLLTEMYVADGLLAFPPIRAQFSTKDSISNYLDIIYRHGYTKEQMDKTMRYYFEKKPKKLENIYDLVLTKLNEKQALLTKEGPPPQVIATNLWNGPGVLAVPEAGINDPAVFKIPVRDTGNYVLDFTAVVFNDDQSLNPKVTLYFWRADSTKDGYKIMWPGVNLPKDGTRHNYKLTQRLSDSTITHLCGKFFDCDPKGGRWVKHARIENIVFHKEFLE